MNDIVEWPGGELEVTNCPPHDLNAEKAVICSLLVESVTIPVSLKPEHFYDTRNSKIYKSILDLSINGEKFDVDSINQFLRTTENGNNVVDEGYLIELLDCASYTDVTRYVIRLQELYLRRQLILTGHEANKGKISTKTLINQLVKTQDVTTNTYEIFVPRWDNQPADSRPLLKLNEVNILSSGNLSLLISPPGFGKSSVFEAICAARINPSCDALGFCIDTTFNLTYLDTERTQYDHWRSWKRANQRAGVKEGNVITGVEFQLICTLPTAEVKYQHLMRLIHDSSSNILLVDGVGDFVKNVNDCGECNEFISRLTAALRLTNKSIFCTLHDNPGQNKDKPRGHLGSEVLRRAEAVLILKRDPETGQRTLTMDFGYGKNRNDVDNAESHFKWCDESFMFRTCEKQKESTRRSTKDKYQKAVDYLIGIKTEWAHNEAAGELGKFIKKDFESGKNLLRALKKNKYVYQTQSGLYRKTEL